VQLRRLIFVGLAALVLLACNDPSPDGRAGLNSSAIEQDDLRLIASLPLGTGPGEITLRPPAEEAVAGGPAALAVDASGTIHVADTLADRIVRIRADGRALSPLEAPAVEDIIVDEEGLVYAFSRRDFRVTVLDSDGQVRDVVEIPRTMRWVTGLCLLADGQVGLHTGYQESVPLRAQQLQQELTEGIPGLDGGRYRTLRRDGTARIDLVRPGSERTLVERRLDVAVATPLGSLTFLGATRGGELVVDVQDVVDEELVTVERMVRRYSSAGLLRSERTVPRGLYAPPHALELAADGTVYVLRPTMEVVEVWAWAAQGGAR
jgi:hypothetical protein